MCKLVGEKSLTKTAIKISLKKITVLASQRNNNCFHLYYNRDFRNLYKLHKTTKSDFKIGSVK
jgi:hypothetical protein